MNTPVREGETIEGSHTMRNRPYPSAQVLNQVESCVYRAFRRSSPRTLSLTPAFSRTLSVFWLPPCFTLRLNRVRPSSLCDRRPRRCVVRLTSLATVSGLSVVEHGVIWISYTPSAQARHIGDNKGIRRERAIDIDVDPADSTDVDVITSAATALSLDDLSLIHI